MTATHSTADPRQLLMLAPLFLLQPILRRIVRYVAERTPSLFQRLGPHRSARFVIDVRSLPFVLLLLPDPNNLTLRAYSRDSEPEHDARIGGGFLDLMGLLDGGADGDALFFSRNLDVTGNTEAVVCLRNALDDVEGSIAETVAGLFGPPGRIALAAMRHVRHRREPRKRSPL